MSLALETRWIRLVNFWADYRQSRVAVLALVVIALMILAALLAPSSHRKTPTTRRRWTWQQRA